MNCDRILADVSAVFFIHDKIRPPVLTIAPRKIGKICGPAFAPRKNRHADQ
jgi:hypothetical protein